MRLIVRNLKKTIEQKTILDGASYSFACGMVYGIVGHKDCGKTTFLKCISGECPVDAGTVKIEADWREHKTKFNDFGILAENPILPEYMTAYEFLKCIMEIHKKDDSEISADDYLSQVGLAPSIRNNLIKDYSISDKRKLALLSLIIDKPSVIIIDEPVKSGNKKKLKEFKKYVTDFSKDRIVIITTDNILIAEELCDELLTLEEGCCKSITKEEAKKRFKGTEEDGNA